MLFRSEVIIGAGAEVASGAALRRSVVWDGARIGGERARVIAWAGGALEA